MSEDRETLAKYALVLGVITSLFLALLLSAHMQQSSRWNAFTHCRLMDLERGDVAHKCKLGETSP